MCYDAETSIKTFIISFTASVYLILRGKTVNLKVYGWFFMFVSFMQLFEYFLWKNQEPGNKINNLISKMIDPYLILQPFVTLLAIYFLGNKNVLYLLIFNFLFFLTTLERNITDKKIRYSSPGEKGHLAWDTVTRLQTNYPDSLNILMFMAPLLVPVVDTSTLLVVLLGVLAQEYHKIQGQLWGSGWCHTANIIPIILVITSFV